MLSWAQSTGDEAASRAALDQLCQVYWPSLYGYARRSGHHKEDAEDLTQGFFGFWLEKRAIDSADRQRGRFRAFLITSFKNFIHNEWWRPRTGPKFKLAR